MLFLQLELANTENSKFCKTQFVQLERFSLVYVLTPAKCFIRRDYGRPHGSVWIFAKEATISITAASYSYNNTKFIT